MIKSIRIVNYRTYKNQRFSLGKINVFIGQNSSGKSNFVHALRMICRKGMDRDIGNYGLSLSEQDFIDRKKPIQMIVITDNNEEYKWVFRLNKKQYKNIQIEYYNSKNKESNNNFPIKNKKIQNNKPFEGMFPIGPKRTLYSLGTYIAEEAANKYNDRLIADTWGMIRDDIIKYLGYDNDEIPCSPPSMVNGNREKAYCADLIIKGHSILEHGNGIQEFVYLIMEIRKWNGRVKIFLIEEPENHMHPRMQRNFLRYLTDLTNDGYQFMITTHTPVFIDNSLLGKINSSKVFLIKKGDDEISNVCPLKYNEKYKKLMDFLYDELEVKASDVLQANGIIWVEGPSDRIYIKRWLELWIEKGGKQQYKEGINYLIMTYGGNIETHFIDWNNARDRLVKARELNKNMFVVMDRDKTDKRFEKKSEVQKKVGKKSTWITHENAVVETKTSEGEKKQVYTIEGYLPLKLRKRYQSNKNKKVEFALKNTEYIKINDLPIYDLEEKIETLYNSIKKWNEGKL